MKSLAFTSNRSCSCGSLSQGIRRKIWKKIPQLIAKDRGAIKLDTLWAIGLELSCVKMSFGGPPAEFVKYIKVIWTWLKVGFCNSPVRYSPSRSARIIRYNRATIPPITLCFTVRVLSSLLYERHVLISGQTFGPQLSPTLCSIYGLICAISMCAEMKWLVNAPLQLYTNPTLRFADQSCQGQRFLLILANTWWNTGANTDDVMVKCMHNYIDSLVSEHSWYIH